jgi:hypothetical protein
MRILKKIFYRGERVYLKIVSPFLLFKLLEVRVLKASELKNKGVKFNLKGNEYELKFDMNTFCELEEVYGDINQAFEDLQNRKIKAIRALIYSAVKAENDKVTLKEVGQMLTLQDMERLGTAINEALQVSMPEAGENVGE